MKVIVSHFILPCCNVFTGQKVGLLFYYRKREDPALLDRRLREKLEKNEKAGRSRMDAVSVNTVGRCSRHEFCYHKARLT